jgi:hypothetical protein
MMELSRFLTLLDEIPVPSDAEFLYDPATSDGALRRFNLLHFLELIDAGRPDTILIGEAPGWRGNSNTGIPFTSVRELSARPGIVTGRANGDGFRLPEHPTALWEASSASVWKALPRWSRPLPLIWAISPTHPHVAGNRLTNRTPRPGEVRAGAPIAIELIRASGVSRVIAIGRKAQESLAANGVDAIAVRHPAQGGARIFAEQMAALGDD